MSIQTSKLIGMNFLAAEKEALTKGISFVLFCVNDYRVQDMRYKVAYSHHADVMCYSKLFEDGLNDALKQNGLESFDPYAKIQDDELSLTVALDGLVTSGTFQESYRKPMREFS